MCCVTPNLNRYPRSRCVYRTKVCGLTFVRWKHVSINNLNRRCSAAVFPKRENGERAAGQGQMVGHTSTDWSRNRTGLHLSVSVEDSEVHSGVKIIFHQSPCKIHEMHMHIWPIWPIACFASRLYNLQVRDTTKRRIFFELETNMKKSVEGKNRIGLFGTLECVMKGSQKQHV